MLLMIENQQLCLPVFACVRKPLLDGGLPHT